MRVLGLPPGWVELELHLVREHGFQVAFVEACDSDDLRAWHRKVHEEGSFAHGHEHWHEG